MVAKKKTNRGRCMKDKIIDFYIDLWEKIVIIVEFFWYYCKLLLLSITSPIWVWFFIKTRIMQVEKEYKETKQSRENSMIELRINME